jgi:peptidyl-tRNA hydrolase
MDLSLHRKYKICGYVSQLVYEEFEDTIGEIRICKSKKNRQHNGQK